VEKGYVLIYRSHIGKKKVGVWSMALWLGENEGKEAEPDFN
jgi:hypothetical protein